MDEIRWAFIRGPKIFTPELYKKFISYIGSSENIIEKFYEEIFTKTRNFILGYGMIMREYFHK